MNKLQGQKIDKIEIVRDGDEVVAKAYKRSNITDCSGYSYGPCWSFVTRASAKCGPNDVFDFNIGAKLAIDRLYEGYDMTPKPKRKPYNGKIFVEEYPGNALKSHKIYQVRNGCIQPATIERDPYIFEDMNDGDLSVAVHATLWDSSIKNITHPLLFCGTRAYFVKE